MKISLCMIVKDEEGVLARCLDCAVQFVDEIVLVDTGSSDNTMEIARRYTPRVYEFQWIDDFSAARNYAFSKATGDYILWLDADDVVDDENIGKLEELKESMDPEVDVAMLKYNVGFDEAGRVNFSYYRERLVRRSNNYRWQEPVHEHIATWGTVRQYDIAITHGKKKRSYSRRNLEIYQKQEREGKELSPRAIYYYARELRTHGLIDESISRYEQFLAIPGVWVEDYITACGDLAGCYRSQGRTQEAMERLMLSFSRALPRAEICCAIADIYREQNDGDKAEFWYKLVFSLPRPTGTGFLSLDFWDYIPHMQLCVLCDRRGDRRQALEHHTAAKALKPDDPKVLYNEAYFFPAE